MASTSLPIWRMGTILAATTFLLALILDSHLAVAVQDRRNLRAGWRLLESKKDDVCLKDCSEPFTCCSNKCKNLQTERNNCGECGNKCGFGSLCCQGICASVAYDVNNCGGCGVKCKKNVRCEYGSCGYAN